jgi:hypothetical protein
MTLTTATLGDHLAAQGLEANEPIVSIDGHAFQNMTIVQAPVPAAGEGPPVPNAIGRQFLSQYFVVVDYAGSSITLWPPKLLRASCRVPRL